MDNLDPKYPRKPRNEHKHVRLDVKYHETIKRLRMNGMYYHDIAKKFDVSKSTIWQIINPERSIELHKRSTHKQDHSKHRKTNAEEARRRYSIEPAFKQWALARDKRRVRVWS